MSIYENYYTEENLNSVTLSENQAMDILALMEHLRTNGNHDDRSLRFAESIIAKKAGYTSREEWTSKLNDYLSASKNKALIDEINQQVYISTHALIFNGTAVYVPEDDDLVYLTEQQAKTALAMNIRIGYADTFSIPHGSMKDFYFYHAITSAEDLQKYYDDFRTNNHHISISPAYDFAHTSLSCADLKNIITEHINSQVQHNAEEIEPEPDFEMEM